MAVIPAVLFIKPMPIHKAPDSILNESCVSVSVNYQLFVSLPIHYNFDIHPIHLQGRTAAPFLTQRISNPQVDFTILGAG